MSSNSETGYGARIGNAQNLVAALQNFNNYIPIKPELSINSYTDLINSTRGLNTNVATKKQTYSLAIENRIQVFEKGELSIKKILSPINGTVKAAFGKNSKEATDVAAIIAKIRGNNIKKRNTTNSDEETVSQSYQSYNSKLQYFSDLLINLINFGANYEPANPVYKASELNTIFTNAVEANNDVINGYTQFKQINTDRINNYILLSQRALSIKESIKAQYGLHSPEYTIIKGIKI